MSSFDFKPSTITKYRAGTLEDPYIDMSEPKKIINNQIQLSEIPVKLNRVVVEGYVEVNDVEQLRLAVNEYLVDYNEGLVFFHSSAEGVTNTFVYKGRGNHYISAHRVWTAEYNGQVTETLGEIIASSSSALESLETLEIAITNSENATIAANTAAAGANNTNNTLNIAETARSSAETSRTGAENSRISAESIRAAAESGRIGAESTRLSNETVRGTAETTRNSNETLRVSNETARQSKINALTHLGEYSASTAYVANNMVNYNGTAYMCILAGTNQTPGSASTYWKRLSNFNNLGTYSTATTYYYGDCVVDSLNQNVYMSIIDSNLNQALTLTAKWQLLITVSNAISTINTTNTNITTAESLRVTAESGRVNAETGRTAAESSRVSIESARVTNDTSRSTAESGRVEAESTRVSSETTRGNNETTRLTNETSRGTAETGRVNAESSRSSAESSRATAESSRTGAEATRVSNESSRVTIEGNRVSAETSRGTAEELRVSAESTRLSSEATRGTNETNRGTVETARANAESNRVLNESSRGTSETGRVNAESSRVTIESGRVSAETARVSAESTRVSNETTRETSETNRGTAESARVSAETARSGSETSRQTNETARIGRDIATQLIEVYNASHAYVPLNKVTFGGQTYQCILNSTGNSPTNPTYFILIAAKGTDGTGAGTVTSVASANSNITVGTGTTTPVITLANVPADLIVDGTINKAYTTAEKTKLAGAAPLESPTFTGVPVAPTATEGTNTTQVATTAFVLAQAAVLIPKMDGAPAAGTSTYYARADHVHQSDTNKANNNSPNFTGIPIAPTAPVGTNTAQIATTAFVLANASPTDLSPYDERGTGTNSHKEGNSGTIASGSYSHAEGENTKAIGKGSHAEGYNSVAYSTYAHAEGYSTMAISADTIVKILGFNGPAKTITLETAGWWLAGSSITIIAAGNLVIQDVVASKSGNTITLTTYTPAIFWKYVVQVLVSVGSSHAEGNYTQAMAESSHAEGYSTLAQGRNSHAEGENTRAMSKASHAEGYYTGIASFDSKQLQNVQATYVSIDEGPDCNAIKALYSVGLISTATLKKNSGVIKSVYINSLDGDGWELQISIGSTLTEFDYTTITFNIDGLATYGIGAHAEGMSTFALQDASHSEGMYSVAYGSSSHSEGQSTVARGASSHAEGLNTRAQGDYSHAEGNNTVASREGAHAEGISTIADARASHAEGESTMAIADAAHAEGYNTKAFNYYAHAEGSGTTAYGSASHAEGNMTTANADYSHAEGKGTAANGDNSHAEGDGSSANGETAHAEGRDTIAGGQASHAEGLLTLASGDYSHAEGYSTIAYGISSHASGQGTISQGINQTAIGKFNTAQGNTSSLISTDHAFIVGNGTDNDSRSNAMSLTWAGNLTTAGNITDGNGHILSAKANLASPTFTGIPIAPSAVAGNNSTQIATTAWVNTNSLIMTTGNLTYYVSTTGSDSNNGTASGTAFLTIAKAISMIPKIIAHYVTINVAAGTYAGSIDLVGFIGTSAFGSSIIINGDSDNTTQSRLIRNVTVYGCTCAVQIEGFKANSNSWSGIEVWNSNYVKFTNFVDLGAKNINAVSIGRASNVYLDACIFSNNKDSAINVNNLAHVYMRNCTGSLNACLFIVFGGGVVNAIGTLPTGTLFSDIVNTDGIITVNSISALSNGSVGDWLIATMAASCSVYDLLYMSSTGYNKAKADADATLPSVAMCLETGTGSRRILKRGYVKNSSWTWTAGQVLYASTATAGAITSTRPATTGNRVQVIGYAESANVIYFNPTLTFVQV